MKKTRSGLIGLLSWPIDGADITWTMIEFCEAARPSFSPDD